MIKKKSENYLTQKIAAGIIGIIGICLIITSTRMTGAVIGIPGSVLSNIVGIGMIIGSVLISKFSKKRNK